MKRHIHIVLRRCSVLRPQWRNRNAVSGDGKPLAGAAKRAS